MKYLLFLANDLVRFDVGEVAELVDALLWGGSDNYVVGVRVSFSSLNDLKAAEIAQLVEHNLAKVRVASSSLVFRSVFLMNSLYVYNLG